jgi:rubrerythrin
MEVDMDGSAILGDIIDVAIGIEKQGAEFYMQASSITKSESTRSVLRELAGIEKEHGKSFAALKNELLPGGESSESGAPEKATLRYLESWTEDVIGKMATASELTGRESDEEILSNALLLEKDSIAYYAGLSTVLTGEHRDTVDRIIREEMDHYTTLQKTLSTLSAIRSKA